MKRTLNADTQMASSQKLLKTSKWTSVVLLGIVCFLCVSLLFLAVRLSLNTPFRFIDDYGDWGAVEIFSDGGFGDWLRKEFVHNPVVRWRPMFVLENALRWKMFGANYLAHHVARLSMTLLSLVFMIAAFRRVLNIKLQKRFGLRGAVSIVTIVVFFLICPNRPDARLGPQEVPTVLFLTLVNWVNAVLLCETDRTRNRSRFFHSLAFIVGCFCLAISKEPNVALLAVFTVFNAIFLWRKPLWQYLTIMCGSALVLVYAVSKIMVISAADGYAQTKITIALIQKNALDLVSQISFFSTSAIIGILIISALVISYGWIAFQLKSFKRWGPGTVFTLLMLMEFAALFAVTSMQWMICLRYWYPLVPVLAMILAIGVYCFPEACRGAERLYLIPVLLFLLYFIGANAANFLYQFEVQKFAGDTEQEVLNYAARCVVKGKKVITLSVKVARIAELNQKFILACGPFREKFGGRVIPLDVLDKPDIGGNSIYITPDKKDIRRTPDREIVVDGDSIFRSKSHVFFKRLSRKLQCRDAPLLMLDAGTFDHRYRWYVFFPEDDVDRTW